MNRYEEPANQPRKEGFGTVVLVWLATLLADFLAGGLALMAGLANYSKSTGDQSIPAATLVLLIYLLAAVGLGVYWWYARHLTARLIGLGLGLFPIFWLILQVLLLA
jgi:hypothetical protein